MVTVKDANCFMNFACRSGDQHHEDRGLLDHATFSSTMNWTVMPLARTKATYVDGQACSSGARPSLSFPVTGYVS